MKREDAWMGRALGFIFFAVGFLGMIASFMSGSYISGDNKILILLELVMMIIGVVIILSAGEHHEKEQ